MQSSASAEHPTSLLQRLQLLLQAHADLKLALACRLCYPSFELLSMRDLSAQRDTALEVAGS